MFPPTLQNCSETQYPSAHFHSATPQTQIDPVALASLQWIQQQSLSPSPFPYGPGVSPGVWWNNPPHISAPEAAGSPPTPEDSAIDSDTLLSALVMTDPKRVSRALNLVPERPEASKYTCKFLFYFLDANRERHSDPRKVEYRFAKDLARCVIGPRGENVRRIFQVNGGTNVTKLRLRGRGSGHKDCEYQGAFFEADHEHLQLCVSVRGEDSYFVFTKVCAEIFDMMKIIIPDYNKDVPTGSPRAAFEITDQRIHIPNGVPRELKKSNSNNPRMHHPWRNRREHHLPPLSLNEGPNPPILPSVVPFNKPPMVGYPQTTEMGNQDLSLINRIASIHNEGEAHRQTIIPSPFFPDGGVFKANRQSIPKIAPKLAMLVPEPTPSPSYEQKSQLESEDLVGEMRSTSEPPLATYADTHSFMLNSPSWPTSRLQINPMCYPSAPIPNTPSPHTQIDLFKSLEKAQMVRGSRNPQMDDEGEHYSTAVAATCSTERVSPS